MRRGLRGHFPGACGALLCMAQCPAPMYLCSCVFLDDPQVFPEAHLKIDPEDPSPRRIPGSRRAKTLMPRPQAFGEATR